MRLVRGIRFRQVVAVSAHSWSPSPPLLFEELDRASGDAADSPQDTSADNNPDTASADRVTLCPLRRLWHSVNPDGPARNTLFHGLSPMPGHRCNDHARLGDGQRNQCSQTTKIGRLR